MFKDRLEAGELLAGQLGLYAGDNPLWLAIPRGGVAVAFPIWKRWGGELDLLITHKIGVPGQPELAVGAVSSDGTVILNDRLVETLQIPRTYLHRAVEETRQEINRRMDLYRGNRLPPTVEGRATIVVDDGVATGFTLLSALKGLRQKQPGKLVLAVPVGPPEALEMLKSEVDHLVFLSAPSYFAAVGQFYRKFDQVRDDQVLAWLNQAWSGKRPLSLEGNC
ncbi:MAG TPA: phosphoribosyltransferase [Firmicutes bacterium]|nr:phosphoribosyltransferase [Bacillota bacterium]